mgnify:CR=1 FL=1
MSRVTVMIGAMKPMTAGHYRLITEAVADSQCPEGETPANETYVLISMQDRIKKNQFPVSGETALSALRDIYMDPSAGLFDFGEDKYLNLIFCHSQKFAQENPERIIEMREIIEGIKEALAARGLANVTVEVEQVRSGPPDVLMRLSESRPNNNFILYTGDDDLKKYQYLKNYATNINFAGFERFEGGMSGTEVRSLFQADSDSPEFDADRFASAFPPGVDASRVRRKYRGAAGANPLKEEINRAEKGTPEYSTYLEKMMDELKYIKSGYDSRKKASARYRKEASKIQDAYSELRKLLRKNNKLLHSDENEPFDRKALKEWFMDCNKKLLAENVEHYKNLIPMLNSKNKINIESALQLGINMGYFEVYYVHDNRFEIQWDLQFPNQTEEKIFLKACKELGIDTTDRFFKSERSGIVYRYPFVTVNLPKKDPKTSGYQS